MLWFLRLSRGSLYWKPCENPSTYTKCTKRLVFAKARKLAWVDASLWYSRGRHTVTVDVQGLDFKILNTWTSTSGLSWTMNMFTKIWFLINVQMNKNSQNVVFWAMNKLKWTFFWQKTQNLRYFDEKPKIWDEQLTVVLCSFKNQR